MHLPRSHAIAEHLDVVPEIGSTNAELVARASTGDVADFSVLATDSQTAGRGRLGRVWVAPPGKTIAVSVLLRPSAVPAARFGWLPLLAGLAMTRAVRELVSDGEVTLKWPNDVQIDGLKVAGLLAELVTGAGDAPSAVVIGAGLNLTMTASELPTPTSTSLALHGTPVEDITDAALSGYLSQLKSLYEQFATGGGDPGESGLRSAVKVACSTIGRNVRVELPGRADLYGVADDIDGEGRLVVSPVGGGAPQHVAAGDVTHLRYE
jgi:BirA family biotin operon repressor/biotin-[acetyl-CoA-carboxylase] ligase